MLATMSEAAFITSIVIACLMDSTTGNRPVFIDDT